MNELALLQTILPVVVALLLGMLIGVERSLAHKTAGLRTYGLVAMGAALFIVVARMGGDPNATQYADSIMRITAAVVTGIGFLCAGAIMLRDKMVVGLTTAAGLWIAAGVGVAAGFELYALAVLTTFLTLLTFTIFWYLERGVQEISE